METPPPPIKLQRVSYTWSLIPVIHIKGLGLGLGSALGLGVGVGVSCSVSKKHHIILLLCVSPTFPSTFKCSHVYHSHYMLSPHYLNAFSY